MAKQLFVNIAASNIGSALARSLTDMTPVGFPQLVLGDGRDYELYLVDGQGGYAPFSGDGSYLPYIAIGDCGYPDGGTAVWTFNGNSTSALAYNISPAALQTALQALASIGSGNATVAGVAGKYYIITFTGTLGSLPQPEITVAFANLTPSATVEISTLTEGSASPARNEVQLATLALNPITFADDWTPITNGWTGQLSTRTLEVIEAFVTAGTTITKTFQITIADPVGVRTTYLKTDATIQCTIIDPESFAGADKPLLATQAALNAAVLGLNNFTREALTSSATGNTNITRPAASRHHTAVVAITGTAGTRTLSVLTTNSPNTGDTVVLVLNPVAVAALVIEVRNATSGGTLIQSITTTDSGAAFFVALNYTGSAWELDFSSSTLLAKVDNLAGLENLAASRANLRTSLSVIETIKTVDFTVSVDDDGKYIPITTAAGSLTVTLPAASGVDPGFTVLLQKTDASTETAVTSPATVTLARQYQSIWLLSDGTQWIVAIQFDPLAATTLVNAYATAANSTGNTTVSRTAPNTIQVIDVTGAARTSVIVLDTTATVPASGDVIKLRFNLPTTASIVIEVRNSVSGGTLIYSLTTDGSGDDSYTEVYFDGSAWQPLLNVMPIV